MCSEWCYKLQSRLRALKAERPSKSDAAYDEYKRVKERLKANLRQSLIHFDKGRVALDWLINDFNLSARRLWLLRNAGDDPGYAEELDRLQVQFPKPRAGV